MIVIPEKVLRDIQSHAGASYPEEGCGVLIGKGGRVTSARPLTNAWNESGKGNRYRADERELAEIEKELAGQPSGILGFFHSHPDAPAWPSPFDLEQAWPVYVYVILGVRKGRPAEVRAWRRSETGEAFEELPIQQVREVQPGATADTAF